MKLKELVENHRNKLMEEHKAFLEEQEKTLQQFNKSRTEMCKASFKRNFADEIPIIEDAGISFEVVQLQRLEDERADEYALRFKKENEYCNVKFNSDGSFLLSTGDNAITFKNEQSIELLSHLYYELIERFELKNS